MASSKDGLFWVSDGRDRIAALPERAMRFFRCGVRHRCEGLVDRYLKGVVPVRPGSIAINFGANIGEVAITLASYGVGVIAIEPDPNVLPLLRANVEHRTIEVVPVAAWDHDGELDMFIASNSADTSAFNVSPDRRRLRCNCIDTLVEERGIEHIDLIIGDAEGAEPEVLRGARGSLRITDYVSVCASAERCGERTLEACEDILREEDFDIIHRDEDKFCILIGRNRLALG